MNFDRPQRQFVPYIGIALLILCILVAIQSYTQPHSLLLPNTGREAQAMLTGAHELEQDGQQTFRWTSSNTTYQISRPSQNPLGLLLRIGGVVPGLNNHSTTISANGTTIALFSPQPQPRTYHLLIPSQLTPELQLNITNPTNTVAPDPRPVGLRLIGISISQPGPGLPVWFLIGVEGLLLVMLSWLGYRLCLPFWLAAGLPLLAAFGILAIWVLVPLLAWNYLARLCIALSGLTAAVAIFLKEERLAAWGNPTFLRTATGLALLACAIRLIGALYPLYQAHDLPLNVERFIHTIGGTLISSNRSFEFRSGITIYPPGPYLALLPALLLGIPPALLVQGGNAIIDGLGALTTIALARALGASERVALYAGLLYAAMPVMLTSIYWGHSAQIFGQALMAPIAIALLLAIRHRSIHTVLLAATFLAYAFFSHIGVTIVAVAWLGLTWGLLLIRRTLPARLFWQITIALGIAGLIGLLFVYLPALALKVEQTAEVTQRVTSQRYSAWGLIWRAAWISFYNYGLPVALLGLILTIYRWKWTEGAAELVAGWIITAICFWLVEMATGLQVRYFVFLAPIACILIGKVLETISQYTAWGRWLALAIAFIMLAQGCSAWYNATFADIQMSMVPLLR